MTAVAAIPGDGVGPELMAVAFAAIEATGAAVRWDRLPAGADGVREAGEPLPAETVDGIRHAGVALKGPLATPVGGGHGSLNGRLRAELDLFAALRPCRSLADGGRTSPACDLLIVRENHEDVFMGIEFPRGGAATERLRDLVADTHGRALGEDAGVSLRPISAAGTERVVRLACEQAVAAGRRRLTVGHKANVMLASDLLFLEVARGVVAEFGEVEYEEVLIDTLCGRLVSDPGRYEAIVLPNLFGDIVSDIGAALVGGTGMAPGANLGPECAVFEAVHGAANRIAGRDLANPTGLLLAGAMLLRHVGEADAGDRLERAVREALADPDHLTYDQAPPHATPVGTREFGERVVERIERQVGASEPAGGRAG